jgi:hypothetical protein
MCCLLLELLTPCPRHPLRKKRGIDNVRDTLFGRQDDYSWQRYGHLDDVFEVIVEKICTEQDDGRLQHPNARSRSLARGISRSS